MKGYIAIVIIIILCAFVITDASAYIRQDCPVEGGMCILYDCRMDGGREYCVRIN